MSGARILVVDDNAANVKLARFVLSKRDFEVRVAVNAEEAMQEIVEHRPQLVLMDIQMPGTDGLMLTRLLKADPKTKDLIIVAFTAFAMEGDARKSLAAGCDGYLAKPIDTHTFANQVAAFLEGSHV